MSYPLSSPQNRVRNALQLLAFILLSGWIAKCSIPILLSSYNWWGKKAFLHLLAPLESFSHPQFYNNAYNRILKLLWTLLFCYLWRWSRDSVQIRLNLHRTTFVHLLQGIAVGLGSLLIPFFAFVFLTGTHVTLNLQLPKLLWNFFFFIPLFSLCTSLYEELICREYLIRKFKSWHGSVHFAPIAQAIIFGLGHYHNVSGGWKLVMSTGIGGLFMGYAFLYSGNVAYSVGIHTGLHMTNSIFSFLIGDIDFSAYEPYLYVFGRNMLGLIGLLPMLCYTVYFARKVEQQQKATSTSVEQ